MNIRRTILSIFALSFLGFVLVLYINLRSNITRHYLDYERATTFQNLRLALAALNP